MYRCECQHVGCYEFVLRTVFFCCYAIVVVFDIIFCAVDDIADEPTVYVVEFEPLAWSQVQRQHWETWRASRNDVRTIVGVAPLYHVFHQPDASPPSVSAYAAAQVAVVATVSGFLVFASVHLIEK